MECGRFGQDEGPSIVTRAGPDVPSPAAAYAVAVRTVRWALGVLGGPTLDVRQVSIDLDGRYPYRPYPQSG